MVNLLELLGIIATMAAFFWMARPGQTPSGRSFRLRPAKKNGQSKRTQPISLTKVLVVVCRSVRRIPVWCGRTVQAGRLETSVLRLSDSLFVRLQSGLRNGRSYVQQRVRHERGRVQEPRTTARRLQWRVFIDGRCLSRDLLVTWPHQPYTVDYFSTS